MGSGGMVVLDETSCMVNTAQFFLEFAHRNRAANARRAGVGTKRMLEILQRITSGNGKEGDIELLEELRPVYSVATSLCDWE